MLLNGPSVLRASGMRKITEWRYLFYAKLESYKCLLPSEMWDGIESRIREQKSPMSWRDWKGRIKEVKGTPINLSWLLQVSEGRDRSRGEGWEEGQKDVKITTMDTPQWAQRSVISAAHLHLSAGYSGEWGEVAEGFCWQQIYAQTLLSQMYVPASLCSPQSPILCVCKSLCKPNAIQTS